MIDTDKMRAAFAATPLCQNRWTEKDGDAPTKLCALSSLVSFAGVQPDLIAKLDKRVGAPICTSVPSGLAVMPQWVAVLALPILYAEYGIPERIAAQFPIIFDRQENEWRGVEAVLALCERFNMDELHTEAIVEDARRFPPRREYATVFGAHTFRMSDADMMKMLASTPIHMPLKTFSFDEPAAETKAKKPAPSKFWTAEKFPIAPKKFAGKLTV